MSERIPDQQVRLMFDRVAGVYDRMNGIMSAGLHHHWRARAADVACVGPGDRVLDVATGTGDLAVELAGRVGPSGEVIGLDFSSAMLERARVKAPELSFEAGDAQALPYAADAFDAATVSFGARNFGDLAQGLSEMVRVVRPGGRVVILELTTPTRPPLSWFFSFWFDRIVPRLGRMTGERDAYAYLPASVRRFPDGHGLGAIMAEQAGLEDVRWILTAGGIIAVHHGTVRAG